MTLKAGESDEMHSHRNETVYFDKGGSVVVHLPDGGSAELAPPDGCVLASGSTPAVLSCGLAPPGHRCCERHTS